MPSKTYAEKLPHVTFGIHKKQSFVFCPQLRNTRTAAGFEHMSLKTHVEKLPHVTFGIHKKNNLLSAALATDRKK